VPFQFNPVMSRLEALDVESLRVKTGEALAVTSSLQLHCFLASDDDSSGKDGCHQQSSDGKGGYTARCRRAGLSLPRARRRRRAVCARVPRCRLPAAR
jgi:hypothetical protein